MYLSKLIQSRLQSQDFNLFGREGTRLDCALVLKEFLNIRNYLTHHCAANDVIAIKATKDYRYLLTVLAAMDTGITYIPMMVDYPDHRVEQIREDSHFKLLITDAVLETMVESKFETKAMPTVSPDHTAYIIFTSGSTGKPKGVMIPRKALENFMKWVGKEFSFLGPSDRMLQVTEFTFDIVLTDVGLFLERNIQTYFSNFHHDLFKLAYEIETFEISALSTVPNNLSMLLSDIMKDRVDLTKLKTLMIAGARFSFGLYQKCQNRLGTKINLYNLYGPTESTVYSHQKKMGFDEAHDCSGLNIAIGKPLPNVTCLIMKDGKRLGVKEEGELLLGGIQLLSGYMNDQDKTKMALINFEGQTFYKTGDISFYDEKDDYFIIGRLDDTIKCRGFRINLLDVDSYIHKLPYIEDCATIAIPHEIAENQTIAFLRVKEPKTVKEVKKDLLQYLLDYQIPEKIIFVESYPTNSSGKIDKKQLRENYLNK